MMIINPYIFKQLPNITFGFSTKLGLNREAPYYFNMSYTVDDDSNKVDENRRVFFDQLGLSTDSVTYQKQVNSNKINIVNSGGECGESDAMITTKKGIGIAISTADCCAIFIYDTVQQVIAGIHSGWRGTCKRILSKVLDIFLNDFNSKPENLICYLSPSISKSNYIVGPEVAQQFDLRYIMPVGDKFLLNISKIKEHGLPLGTLLNVNVPDLPENEIAGLLITKQGKSRWDDTYEKRTDPYGKDYYWLTGDLMEEDKDLEFDQYAIKQNYVAITPIHFDLTDYETFNKMKDWNIE